MKREIAIAVWFLGVIIVAALLFGCATNKEQPMYDNLLLEKKYENLAYKSITIKDIVVKDECKWSS